MKDSFEKMTDKLYDTVRTLPLSLPYKKSYVSNEKKEYVVDIASIGAYAIDYNLRDFTCEAFTTSIYKLNQIVKERYTAEEDEDNEPVDTLE